MTIENARKGVFLCLEGPAMRVLVAIPTFDAGIKPATFESVANLDWGDNDVSYRSISGYDCALARQHIANEAVERGFDYVFMVDYDVVVPSDALTMLMEWDEPVMLGYYAHQGSFAPPHGDGKTCLCKPPSYHDQFTGAELLALREAGEHKVPIRGGGLGCALIKVDVFSRLQYPYFKFVVYGDRHGVLGEDLYFCKKCRDAGMKLYGDARVACGHHFRHIEAM